jgi:UDPglucose 6-dehydrogenase
MLTVRPGQIRNRDATSTPRSLSLEAGNGMARTTYARLRSLPGPSLTLEPYPAVASARQGLGGDALQSFPGGIRKGADMDMAFIGAGHVGLVSAACMAAIGHRVRVFDIDARRIASLGRGEVPFLEPGLPELVASGLGEGRLSFDRDPVDALSGAQLIFVCVGTLPGPAGDVDLSGVIAATDAVARYARSGCVLVNRSTAPVGTAEYIRSVLEEERPGDLGVAVNPEFLAEGSAVLNFLVPDRLVIGAWEQHVVGRIVEAYEPIVQRRVGALAPDDVRAAAEARSDAVPIVPSTPATAELTKYAANAFLAVKISFINEIAAIAEKVGADVTEISRAVGLDRRIGKHFLRAGIGWGGSCFPKDILALQGMAETHGLDGRMLRAANEVNLEQQRWVTRQLQGYLKTLFGRRVGLLGLAFKPDTDDLRSAPALEIASELVRLGVRVRAYDPAIRALGAGHPEGVEIVPDPAALARGADALVLVTEWPEFSELDLASLRSSMRTPLLLDGRNFIAPSAARQAGFFYVGVGRQADPMSAPGQPREVPRFAADDVVALEHPRRRVRLSAAAEA